MLAMKKYRLLRDNQESGPYNFEELTSVGLRSLDLIWTDGETTKWEYAGDMEMLKEFIHD
jgi:hypothetical protein